MNWEKRTAYYSSGKSYTQYFKICEGCGKESWVNRKSTKYCSRECCNITLRKIDSSLEHFFREKITRLRSNAKKRNKVFELVWQDLLELYNKQNGKCYYTNIEMLLTYSSKTEAICPSTQLSIDRIDSSKGYVKDNIVLCIFCINNFKGEMSIEEFKTILKQIKLNEDKI